MASQHHADREMRLDGQVALVTGGGRGIGRAIALALSVAGAAVAVCARTSSQLAETVQLIERQGGRALALPADVADRHAVEAMIEQAERALGPIDTLVNDAAIGGPAGPFAETDPDAWWEVQVINLRGPVYCSRAVLPGMIRRGRGRIINISSGAGFAAWPLVSAYAVSKAALFRLSENLAAETRDQGIAVFAIDPGLVHTDMVEGALHWGEPSIEQSFRVSLAAGEDIPPDRAAQMVVFLASGRGDALSGRFLGPEDDEEALVGRAGEIQEQDLRVLRPRF
jgi:NAD(P)-dependent dehydrogenase (short-subunit alcohol dehydrogenase family)